MIGWKDGLEGLGMTGWNRLEGRNNTHDHGHQDEHTTR